MAITHHDIGSIARKFHPAPGGEADYLEAAADHLSIEDGHERVFSIGGKKMYIAVCYDTYGIHHNRTQNPGVDAILSLIHGFGPQGQPGGGSNYFARLGLAGAAKQWNCPVFAAAVFPHCPIHPNFPSGVAWDQGSLNPRNWKFDYNPIRQAASFKTEEGTIVVRFFDLAAIGNSPYPT